MSSKRAVATPSKDASNADYVIRFVRGTGLEILACASWSDRRRSVLLRLKVKRCGFVPLVEDALSNAPGKSIRLNQASLYAGLPRNMVSFLLLSSPSAPPSEVSSAKATPLVKTEKRGRIGQKAFP